MNALFGLLIKPRILPDLGNRSETMQRKIEETRATIPLVQQISIKTRKTPSYTEPALAL
ncbi:MAG: hypothetical protein WAT53_07735 [Nitrosomonas sp.]|nr:hypothetical protein [Nitrosomonas sp.]